MHAGGSSSLCAASPRRSRRCRSTSDGEFWGDEFRVEPAGRERSKKELQPGGGSCGDQALRPTFWACLPPPWFRRTAATRMRPRCPNTPQAIPNPPAMTCPPQVGVHHPSVHVHAARHAAVPAAAQRGLPSRVCHLLDGRTGALVDGHGVRVHARMCPPPPSVPPSLCVHACVRACVCAGAFLRPGNSGQRCAAEGPGRAAPPEPYAGRSPPPLPWPISCSA